MANHPLFFKIFKSGRLYSNKQFVSDQISIGSSEEGPSLPLVDPSVCYWHALVEKRGIGYYISDLGSPTGTFVNGKKILESPLKHGDEIHVGNFTIHFYIKVPFAAKGKKTASPLTKPIQQAVAAGAPQAVPAPAPQAVPAPAPQAVPAPVAKPAALKAPPAAVASAEPAHALAEPVPQEEELTPPPVKEEETAVEEAEFFPEPEQAEEPVEPAPPVTPEQKAPTAPVQTSPLPEQKAPARSAFPFKLPAFKAPFKITPEKQKPAPQPMASHSLPSQAPDFSTGLYPDPENSAPPPEVKGTYAPPSTIKNLDKDLSLGAGPIVEVLIAWKERILRVKNFGRDKLVTFGSDSKADICFPNLLGVREYPLLNLGSQVQVGVSGGVKASVKDSKGWHSFKVLMEKGLLDAGGNLSLQQKQLVKLEFGPSLRVYIRFTNRVQKALMSPVFNFSVSEMTGIMMSCLFMCVLVFYVGLFSSEFLDPEENLEEEGIKKAMIEFKKKRPVRLKMAKRAGQKRFSVPIKKAPKRRTGVKKQGKAGRLAQAAAKPKAKSKKKTITSARPGGSVTTKKSGGSAKSPRPDPNKVGLLGVFGSKGTQTVLDKAYSGAGELAGLADQATGQAGQKDAYTGEGIGTKFKNTGAGGKGSALIGVSSGIQTKGRGAGGGRGDGRGGTLGSRGAVQLELGVSDLDVGGGVDKDAILRVIRRNKYKIESCIGIAKQKRPNLSGKLLLQWEIMNERVRNTKVRRNTSGDAVLARCIMSRIADFRFTGTGLKSGQIGTVSIPFVF